MAKTKTKGSKKLSYSFKCDICGKKANVRHERIGTKCFEHVPVIKEKWWL